MYKIILKRTFEVFTEKKDILLKVLFIPAIALTLINYDTYYIQSFILFEEIPTIIYLVLSISISVILNILISITTHRVLLLENKDISILEIYKWGKREWNFFLNILIISITLVLFALVSYIVLIPLLMIIDKYIIKAILLVIIVLYFLSYYARCLLVFPAISIDKPITVSKALDMSKNHKFLVLFMVILIPMFLSLLLNFVYGLAIEFLAKGISDKFYILNSLLSTFIIVLVVSFLSTTYEYLISLKEEEEALKEPEIIKKENIYKMIIDERYDVSFDSLKQSLFEQYKTLGFTSIIIDKENSWMIKKPDFNKAYILLSYKNKSYEIETFNVLEEPVIEVKKRL